MLQCDAGKAQKTVQLGVWSRAWTCSSTTMDMQLGRVRAAVQCSCTCRLWCFCVWVQFVIAACGVQLQFVQVLYTLALVQVRLVVNAYITSPHF